MTTGALIFAFNNEKTDYIALARWSAANIRRHLNIPTAIVTDCDPRDPRVSGFDQVIVSNAASGGKRYFEDYQASVTWHNAGRPDAYRITPWSQTLVLDADYVVASDQLKILLDSDQEFLAHAAAFDVTGSNSFDGLNHYGEYRMPMSWATVMMFRRCRHSRLIFDCMSMVRANWNHYRQLYKIPGPTYRNDHALSIALNLVNGQTLKHPAIAWNLASVLPEHELSLVEPDCYKVTYTDSNNRPRWITLRNQDFHAMGKRHLENLIETH